MYFSLIDSVLERSEDRVLAIKHVSMAEEYLRDHFAGFPVLPGVLMLEAMVQAARLVAEVRDQGMGRWVLGEVRALKYGRMVRPGQTLRIDVSLVKWEGGAALFRGEGRVVEPSRAEEPPVAVSGRFTLRTVSV